MTPTTHRDERVTMPIRLAIDEHAPAFSKAMARLDQASVAELDRAGLDAGLRELVRVRASQLNGYAYCVNMHTKDARAVGESDHCVDQVVIWRESPFFTARERAAFAFTESVTRLADTHVPAAAFDDVAQHFSPDEIGALLSLIVTINAWNMLAVASRAWEPELDHSADTDRDGAR